MMICAKAPLRISFAGGGTDVPPYCHEHGGVVLNATVNRYAYAEVIPDNTRRIVVVSMDLGIVEEYGCDEVPDLAGKLSLVRAVLKNMNVREGCRVLLHNDAPPGSGLGSSSALVVALTAAISNWRNGVIDRRTLAEKAIQIERVEMGIAGGFQDQYTAAFGGINFMEFRRRETSVEPLHLSKAMQEEMEDSLVLCYTGIIRVSSNIIEDQVNNVVERKGDTLQAMEELKMITSDMRNALLAGRMNSFGRLLQESWEQKKRMSGKISTPKIDEMLAEARNQGACGGKLLGAGGGGYVLLYCPGPAKTLVCQRLQEMGGTIVPWEFEMEGAVTWRSSVPYAMQTVQTGSGPEQEEIA